MTIEVTGKKVDDAIKEGLRTLDTTLDEVQIEVISQGGLFKKAKVKMTLLKDIEAAEAALAKSRELEARATEMLLKEKTEKHSAKPDARKAVDFSKTENDVKAPVKETKAPTKEAKAPVKTEAKPQDNNIKQDVKKKDAAPKADMPKRENSRKEEHREEVALTPEITAKVKSFLSETLRLMNVEAEIKDSIEKNRLCIDIVTDNSAVIGYRGETLDALEYLASLTAGKGDERFIRVKLDSNNYRAKREESLNALALRMADKCVKNGKKVTLEAMSSAHRRIIHSALSSDDRVFTKSEGKEPNRRIIILPKRK